MLDHNILLAAIIDLKCYFCVGLLNLGLRDIFQVLEDNLGRDAFHVLRRLGVNDDVLDGLRSDYPRDIKEVIHRALRHWEDSVRHMEPKTKIVEALKKESRNDLVNKIKSL